MAITFPGAPPSVVEATVEEVVASLDLGTASQAATTDFDPAGAAAGAQSAAIAAAATDATSKSNAAIAAAAADATSKSSAAVAAAAAASDPAGSATAAVAGHTAASPAHTAAATSVTASGLVIVTTSNVQAALAELDAATNLRARRSATWLANHTYKAGEVVVQGGLAYAAVADFTSGASFVPSNWVLLSANEVASMAQSTVTAFTSTVTAISGWQIVVPANSGPLNIWVPGGMLIALVSGTNANSVPQQALCYIKDEANVQVAFNKYAVYPSNAGVSQTHVITLPLGEPIPNNASTKTYSVWVQCQSISGGASVTLHTSASGFTDPVLQAIRR